MKSIALLKRDVSRQGGLEKTAARITTAFQRRGCKVSLISKASFSHPLGYGKIYEFDKYCQTMVQLGNYDCVIGFDRTRKQTHLRAGNGVHAAYLDLRKQHSSLAKKLSFIINPLHKAILKMEKEGFENPELKKIIVNSNLVKGQILNYYKVNPDKIVVIHNGVEWKELEESFNETFTHKRVDQFEFLFVGHNFERKGLKPLLKALSQIKNRNFHLAIVGNDKNIEHFKDLVTVYQLDRHVTFHDLQASVIPFYQKADALVIPSLYDPFANVTVEALAMGLRVISSSLNGGSEVISFESGITYDFNSHENLVSALESAMDLPKTEIQARRIRASVSHLDYDHQLTTFCDICLS